MLVGYEVVRIKIAPAERKFGKFYPQRELYASSSKNSSDWGDIAWSYGRNQRQETFEHYNGLVAKYRKADSKLRRPLVQ